MARLAILTFALILSAVQSARILAFFPIPSISHQVPLRHITQELAKKHEVVVITTDPAFKKGEAPANLTEIDVHDISYKLWREQFLATATGKKEELVAQIRVANSVMLEIIVEQLKIEEIQKVLYNDTFDLLLVEAWTRPAIVMTHFHKVPTIVISTFSGYIKNYHIFGAVTHPLLYPLFLNQRIYNLSLWEKVYQVYFYYTMIAEYMTYEVRENEVLQSNFGRDMASLSELANNVDMLFLNVYPIWDGNRPVPPSVIYIGGLHQLEPNKLPKDLETYLNLSKNGVVYVSFGTNMNPSNLDQDKIQALIKVFSQLPYDFLWKWDSDVLPGKPKNIKISKWLPQNDLLYHPKIKLFISQCGLQSTDEAISAGMPILCIPMVADQWLNAEKCTHFKAGLNLDMESLTEKQLKDAIEELIGNPSYRHNMKELKSLMHDQPETALERAMWWTEHVLRHKGAKHLRAPTANMSWSEYLELDVVLVLLGIASIVILVIGVAVYYICKRLKTLSIPVLKVKEN